MNIIHVDFKTTATVTYLINMYGILGNLYHLDKTMLNMIEPCYVLFCFWSSDHH
jgi:hypothetical protein